MLFLAWPLCCSVSFYLLEVFSNIFSKVFLFFSIFDSYFFLYSVFKVHYLKDYQSFKTEQLIYITTLISIERRWSSRTFRYGYLVTTSPQSLASPSAIPPFSGWVIDFGRFQLPWCDGRCVQGPGTYSPRHSDSRLLAIPASCSRVADYNPNWDWVFVLCLTSPSRFTLFPAIVARVLPKT